ncbi:DUF397 domain-containing protein [Streptomyces broussonetiae]|uniref:DUF397 domain-containing protein n=1 Tax=Streptomyces broussonetiae TaxID=2686304 RepID=A0ABV5EFQ3_9ACTN
MTKQTWQKSTYSEEGSACVEISPTPTTIHIRDSKHPHGPRLALPRTAWSEFIRYTGQESPEG